MGRGIVKIGFILMFFCVMPMAVAQELDFSNATIPLQEIFSGGPPKDGIPSLTDPEFIPAQKATTLEAEDRVLGFVHEGVAKAYPIRILNWHEVVNDRIGERDFVVTYCPLCGSGIAFDAKVKGERLLFGVSGRLYNSDVLLYDRKTGSLWSQLKMEAVTGKFSGRRLRWLPLSHTTWRDWKEQHPDTLVLSQKTGYFRNYAKDPYQGYADKEQLLFPVSNQDKRLSTKAWVLGVFIQGAAKAYPFSALSHVEVPLKDELGGKAITIHYNKVDRSAWVTDEDGGTIPSVQAYWFAWFSFYPETALWSL